MPIRSSLVRLLGLLAISALAGCSTVQVHSEAAPGTDFGAYKSFVQTAPPKSAGRSMPGYSQITGDHIQASIAHELEAKGLSLTSTNNADLVVAFSIDGQPRQDVQWDGGMGGWYGGSTYTVNYVKGTLTIDVFDAKKKKLVWHAYGQTNLYGSDPGRSSQKVDEAVSEILKGFPPEPKSK